MLAALVAVAMSRRGARAGQVNGSLAGALDPFRRTTPKAVEVVIAAYEEPTDWITPMTDGIPNLRVRLFCKSARMTDPRCVHVPNVGQDHYVTLSYIVANYEDLPDVMIVTHNSIKGRLGLCRKLQYALDGVRTAELQARFVQQVRFRMHSHGSPAEKLGFQPGFKLDQYRRGSGTAPQALCLADPRPLGAWYQKYLGPPHGRRVGYNDIYAVARERIRRYSNDTYTKLLDQVVACGEAAAEIDHYLERAVMPMYADASDVDEAPGPGPGRVCRSFIKSLREDLIK